MTAVATATQNSMFFKRISSQHSETTEKEEIGIFNGEWESEGDRDTEKQNTRHGRVKIVIIKTNARK